MAKSIKGFVVGLSAAIVLFVVVGGLHVRAATKDDGAYRQLGVFSEVLQRIRTEYVTEPNFPSVSNGALHGLLESLDSDSSYLSPAEYKEYKAHKAAGKAGIGAVVSKRFGYAAIVSVTPGGPAEKAGLQAGDIIEAIENKTSRELSLAQIEEMVMGEPGSTLNIAVVRPRKADPDKIAITRAVVGVPPTTAKMLENNIGIIDPNALTKGKAQEIGAKIKELQKEGAKKLLLDLRYVAEGDEAEGVAVANLFLDHGEITYVQGQKVPRKDFNAEPQKQLWKGPLVVLANRGTAGAAEVVAASILENGRGDVLGDKTFGEGSMQQTIELPDGAALFLTVAKYYTPGGKAIQDTAVTPNILVASNDDDFTGPDEDDSQPQDQKQEKTPQQKSDEQLQRAIAVLKARG